MFRATTRNRLRSLELIKKSEHTKVFWYFSAADVTVLVRCYETAKERRWVIEHYLGVGVITTITRARGVVVIVVGNERGDSSSNPGRD